MPDPKRKPRRKGPPPVEIDPEQLRKLGVIGATQRQVGAWFGISQQRVSQRLKTDPVLAAAWQDGTELGDLQIKRSQYELAVDGKNPTMLIWLGKVRLGQVEPARPTEPPLLTPETLEEELQRLERAAGLRT